MAVDKKRRPLKGRMTQRSRKDETVRRRTSRACDRCKIKKQKVLCDGSEPCNQCSEADTLCSYETKHVRDSKAYYGKAGELFEEGLHRLLSACKADPNYCNTICGQGGSGATTNDILTALGLDITQLGNPPTIRPISKKFAASRSLSTSTESEIVSFAGQSDHQPTVHAVNVFATVSDEDDVSQDDADEEEQEMLQTSWNTNNNIAGTQPLVLPQDTVFSNSYALPSANSKLSSDTNSAPAAPSSFHFAQVVQAYTAQGERQHHQMQQYINRAYAHAGKHDFQHPFSASATSNHQASPIQGTFQTHLSYGSIAPPQTQMRSFIPSIVTPPAQQLSDHMIEDWLQQTSQYQMPDG